MADTFATSQGTVLCLMRIRSYCDLATVRTMLRQHTHQEREH